MPRPKRLEEESLQKLLQRLGSGDKEAGDVLEAQLKETERKLRDGEAVVRTMRRKLGARSRRRP